MFQVLRAGSGDPARRAQAPKPGAEGTQLRVRQAMRRDNPRLAIREPHVEALIVGLQTAEGPPKSQVILAEHMRVLAVDEVEQLQEMLQVIASGKRRRGAGRSTA
jgi:hypothetical protein